MMRIKGCYGDTVVGAWDRPTASRSQAPVLLRGSKHPDTCWRHSTARHTQPRKFLQIAEENVLLELLERRRRKGMSLLL